ncbi:PTS sugar transporter subunit IIA [Enterocloster lavalensis]|uniref:PTS sugar transporter subunit IIA n=1 Tax=Enterocloster lavalensis TaxID=460384 RepID=UPI002665FCE2|nr:PTS sugar transporter subunit IIA [Enterocloster lavalensis]
MRNVILISHGKLSEGMAHSAQMVAGEKSSLSWYGLMPGELVEDLIGKVRAQVEKDPDNQYLIISDVFGGSVCNGSVTLQDLPNVKLATGMNLLLVIQLLFSDEEMTDEEFESAVQASIETVRVLPRITGCDADGAEDFF